LSPSAFSYNSIEYQIISEKASRKCKINDENNHLADSELEPQGFSDGSLVESVWEQILWTWAILVSRGTRGIIS